MQDNNKLPCVCVGSVGNLHFVHVFQPSSRLSWVPLTPEKKP